LLVFNCFITNCYIYENSTVWIILPLSMFPGKIEGSHWSRLKPNLLARTS
jgi:hypothetical protein